MVFRKGVEKPFDLLGAGEQTWTARLLITNFMLSIDSIDFKWLAPGISRQNNVPSATNTQPNFLPRKILWVQISAWNFWRPLGRGEGLSSPPVFWGPIYSMHMRSFISSSFFVFMESSIAYRKKRGMRIATIGGEMFLGIYLWIKNLFPSGVDHYYIKMIWAALFEHSC